jgi:hypothetical protein
MNILLIQDDANVREKVAFVLEGQFNSVVHEASTPEEAKTILVDKAKDINLIVVDCAREKSKDFDRLRAEFSQIQSLVFLQGGPEKRIAISAPPGHPVPMFVDRSDIVQNLITAVGGMIKQSMLPNPDDDRNFCKIRTKLLLSVCPLEGDIYIRLSEAKYLKLMRQGDTFDLADMEKYTVKKGVEYLYLRKNSVSEFIKKYQAELLSYLDRKPEMAMEEVAKLNESVFETVQELGGSMGFTPAVQQMAKTQVQLTMKAMGKSPRLSKLFDKLESYKGKYIASHSTMTGYLACAIASQMKWGSETTFHKLTLASFLHDVTLTNHDLAACATIEEAQDPKFTDAERKAYKNHTVTAADVAKQFNEVPPDVDVIIAQHHERADGTGFPRGLSSAYIAPLSAIFIVAHDMAKFALDRGPSFKVGDFLEASRERYKPSQFRKVVQAIEQLV